MHEGVLKITVTFLEVIYHNGTKTSQSVLNIRLGASNRRYLYHDTLTELKNVIIINLIDS